jgi:hypothetical protein
LRFLVAADGSRQNHTNTEEATMTNRGGKVDRGMGYLGLFLIGTLSWLADRLSASRVPMSAAERWPESQRAVGTTLVVPRSDAHGARRAA